jgi:hypothetical protein
MLIARLNWFDSVVALTLKPVTSAIVVTLLGPLGGLA